MIRTPTVTYTNLCFLTMLAFAIGDLYFAYTDLSCTYVPISNTKLGFGLGTWLKVSGYTNLLFLLIPIAGFCLQNVAPSILLIYQIFAGVYVFFRFIWLVLGAIIFWGHLSGTGLCTHALNTYMWINLIYSFFVVLALCYNQQQVYSSTYSTRTEFRSV